MSGHTLVGEPVKINLKFKNSADAPSWTLADALISNKDPNICKIGVKERTFDTRTMTRLTTTVTPPTHDSNDQSGQSLNRKLNGPARPNNDYNFIKFEAKEGEKGDYFESQTDAQPVYSSTITISKRVYDPRDNELIIANELEHAVPHSTNNIARLEDLIQNSNPNKLNNYNRQIIYEENSKHRSSTDNFHKFNEKKKSIPITESIPKLYVPQDFKIPKLIHPTRYSLNSGSPQLREIPNLLIDRGYGTYNGPFMTREESYNMQRSLKVTPNRNIPVLNGNSSQAYNTLQNTNIAGDLRSEDVNGRVGDGLVKSGNTGEVSRDLENLMDSIALYNQSTNNQPIYSEVKKPKKEKSTDCDSALIPLICVHG